MTRRAWPSPAKINLFLHVLGRREDGYHRLQTAFQFLDFGDTVTIEVRDDGTIDRAVPLAGIRESQDLALRAAQLLKQRTHCPLGCTIEVDKHIPLGGGLGGGSSNAATTLLVLNRLWNTGLSTEALLALGLELGADVPVFLYGAAAWAEGVGEVLQPLSPPTPWYLLVAPRCPVDTATVFAAPALRRDHPPITPADLEAGHTVNVLEPVVREIEPRVAEVLDHLAALGSARLSGSGATSYLAFNSHAEAAAAQAKLPDLWWSTVARGLNQSPLKLALEGPGTR